MGNGKWETASKRGFTIVELMVTVVLAGIIIPAIAIALNNLAVTNKLARDQALTNAVVQNKTESLRSIGYNAIPTGATASFTTDLPATIGSPKSASYTVSTPSTGIKQIDASVSFTEYHTTKSLSYRTYISELGVGQ
jgi:prepilin-type N-terminal cleavage/methylation domain-containing protein